MNAFRSISPSEFFYQHRDLAGFSNPSRSIYSALRELVENSLDAADGFGIKPQVFVKIEQVSGQIYEIHVRDNGTGIPPEHVPKALGKIFYGTKFSLKQSRGTFGMGATMAVLYAQLTTNTPVRIYTSVDGLTFYYYEMMINIEKNEPIVMRRSTGPANGWKGVSIRLRLLGDYDRAKQKILEYIRELAIATPYADILLFTPDGEAYAYKSIIDELPKPPSVSKLHPYGVDYEAVRRLILNWNKGNMVKFLTKSFQRVGRTTAIKFLEYAGIDQAKNPKKLSMEEVKLLVEKLNTYQEFLKPDPRSISPIGERALLEGVKREFRPDFTCAISRKPSSYLGYPFLVEAVVAYGGEIKGFTLIRFANKIPLLYDEKSDVSWKVITEDIDLSRYRLSLDMPIAVVVHVASTKVPFKTLGKEFIADVPEVEREVKLALQKCFRDLQLYLGKQFKQQRLKERENVYRRYLPLIARFAAGMAGEKVPDVSRLVGEAYEEEQRSQ